jgi:formylglycine-generating enzyme required for sulfatase activity
LAEEKQVGQSYRLPTEAEWEYACRAGSTTKYYHGNDASRLGDYAWYFKNARKTNRVGQKKPNAWGLYDMLGNVEEWCADWYDDSSSGSFVVDYYAKSPTDDPKGPSRGQHRVYRGGSFRTDAEHCGSASRGHTGPTGKQGTRGLRVLMVLSGG